MSNRWSRKQNTDSAYVSVAYDPAKTALPASQAEMKNKSIIMFISGPCDWLVLLLLLPSLTI